jgi:glycine cleavage system regulatory protein
MEASTAYWDYNIYNLSSLQVQIQRIDYHENYVTLQASTMMVDVNKRIEDINRNLEALQNANNPDVPT